MKKLLKISLIVLSSIVLLLVIAGVGGWLYLDYSILSFEDDYPEKTDFKEITIDGYTFLDRNDNGELDVYEDSRKSIEERAADALQQMTMDEKIHLLKGSGMASGLGKLEPGEGIPGAVGTIVPTPRLGLPTVFLSDGPAGLRIEPRREGEDRTYFATAFPIATLLASTWNNELVRQVGEAMGNEAAEYGIDVILGPGANIHRNPLNGRNFEYFSEDPILTGEMGAAIVNGIESNGVGTSVKHYVANNQETNRNYNDVLVSDRAMREIYLKGFEIITKKSQPWTIMSSYNKVNGTYTSESRYLLTDVLRDDWGFRGVVMSDWFGGNDAVAQINAGNDLLQPGTKFQWEALQEGAENGDLAEESINTSAERILELIFKSKKMQDNEYSNNPDLKSHARVTRNSATEGMILLKNESTLPLKNIKNIALIGITSFDFIAGGTGSGDVNEAYTVSLEEGLTNAGYEINQSSSEVYQEHKGANEDAFVKPEGMQAMFEPYNPPQISYTSETLTAIAKSSDIGIITIGRNSGEGGDRREKDDFLLSDIEENMIHKTTEAFHNAGKEVVVVLNIGGPIETLTWKSQVDAILLAWQGGQEGGNAVADILSGKVNPSGKLPMTFPVHLSDHASSANFPMNGKPMAMTDMIFSKDVKPKEEQIKNEDYTKYEEGIYVGYRHFDKKKLEVSYPFGFGLSYTNFEYTNPEVNVQNDTINIELTVENVGKISGKEAVQIYVSKANPQIDRPEKELKAYAKTELLKPAQSTSLSIKIPVSELSYWNEDKEKWVLENGTYIIHVGASSRDIRLAADVEI